MYKICIVVKFYRKTYHNVTGLQQDHQLKVFVADYKTPFFYSSLFGYFCIKKKRGTFTAIY